MRRSVTEVLRRGFESTLANWPLIVIRIAESVVLTLIFIAAVVAAIIPVLVAAGVTKSFGAGDANSAAEAVALLVAEHWLLLLYLLILIFVIFGVLIAVHSFVEAGSAQVYVDAELRARGVTAARRPDFEAFSMDRWFAGGRDFWWRVFWIYNLAWSVGGLILLIPLVITMAGMIVISEAAGKVIVGCAGLVITVLVLIPVGIVIGIWTQKAIAVCVGRSRSATDSLRSGWRDVKLDFGRHFGVAVIIIILGFAAMSIVSGLSFPFSLMRDQHAPMLPLMFAPMQIALSIVQGAVSAAMGAWLLACFVALTEER